VVTEGAVASGVRRIEAVTADAARRHVAQEETALREAADLLRGPPLELPKRVAPLLDEQKQLEKQLAPRDARAPPGRGGGGARGGGGRGSWPGRPARWGGCRSSPGGWTASPRRGCARSSPSCATASAPASSAWARSWTARST